MLRYVVVLLVVAAVAAFFAFGGVVAAAVGIAKVILVVSLGLVVFTGLVGLINRRG